MAAGAAKLTLNNLDYFKFKKIILDGNRDDYNQCSKEVKSLCDCVQTIHFREEAFDPDNDVQRLQEISTCYREIIKSKRIDPLDMRIKSGWWGEQKSGLSAGKIKSSALAEILIAKNNDWAEKHANTTMAKPNRKESDLDETGLFVLKHRLRQCFQMVFRAHNSIFACCQELLKASFEGAAHSMSALFITTNCQEWDFYFVPVNVKDNEAVERILENDLITEHDSLWPHGFNISLNLNSIFEINEFRLSCLKNKWPPKTGEEMGKLEIQDVLKQLKVQRKLPNVNLATTKKEEIKTSEPKSPTKRVLPEKPDKSLINSSIASMTGTHIVASSLATTGAPASGRASVPLISPRKSSTVKQEISQTSPTKQRPKSPFRDSKLLNKKNEEKNVKIHTPRPASPKNLKPIAKLSNVSKSSEVTVRNNNKQFDNTSKINTNSSLVDSKETQEKPTNSDSLTQQILPTKYIAYNSDDKPIKSTNYNSQFIEEVKDQVKDSLMGKIEDQKSHDKSFEVTRPSSTHDSSRNNDSNTSSDNDNENCDPKLMKRSGTFTFSDTESTDVEKILPMDGGVSTAASEANRDSKGQVTDIPQLSARALKAAKKIASQRS